MNMFFVKAHKKDFEVYFEDKSLVTGLTEDQAFTLVNNLDDLLEEFLVIDESDLDDEHMAD